MHPLSTPPGYGCAGYFFFKAALIRLLPEPRQFAGVLNRPITVNSRLVEFPQQHGLHVRVDLYHGIDDCSRP